MERETQTSEPWTVNIGGLIVRTWAPNKGVATQQAEALAEDEETQQIYSGVVDPEPYVSNVERINGSHSLQTLGEAAMSTVVIGCSK